MTKATDELLKDHKMIRKVLAEFSLENPRFTQIAGTLHRLVLGHAWFEDEIFFPAVQADPLIAKPFMDEMFQEHRDINTLLKLVRETPPAKAKQLASFVLQLRTVLDTHFAKEEDALFPLAEKILDNEGLNTLSEEMRRRQTEIQKFAKI